MAKSSGLTQKLLLVKQGGEHSYHTILDSVNKLIEDVPVYRDTQ